MIGRIFENRFRITEKIGEGQFTDLYKALDTKLNRFHAVKILKKDYNDDKGLITAFNKEADAIASLNHPSIVGIFNNGEENGMRYIIMEYLKGKTLKQLISEKGPLYQDQVTSFSEQIASGLKHAHINGVLHGRIKPENIIVTENGEIKLFNFGEEPVAWDQGDTAIMTDAVNYFSPEEIRGEQMDARSDIYAFGITMYEMATGRLPFAGEDPVVVAMNQMQKTLDHPGLLNPAISDKLDAVIMKMLKKAPDDRYQNMDEALADIQRIQGDTPLIYGEVVSLPEELASKGKGPEEQLQQIRKEEIPVHSNWSGEEEVYSSLPDSENKSQYRDRRRSRKLIAMFVILLLLLAGLSFAGVSYFQSLRGDDNQVPAGTDAGPTPVVMIDILGMDEARARLELAKIELELVPNYVPSDMPEGTILNFTPGAGELILPGSIINADVSEPKELVFIPSLAGLTLDEAVARLTEEGLLSGTITEAYSELVPEGIIISSGPDAGEQLPPGSRIDLIVSLGVNEELADPMVPDLTGYTLQAAEDLLIELGLVPGMVNYSRVETSLLHGTITDQGIPAGTTVPQGTEVDIQLGEFIEPEPEPDPGTQPGTQPDTQPDPDPETTPETRPATRPATRPSTRPSTTTPSSTSPSSTTPPSTTTPSSTSPSSTTPPETTTPSSTSPSTTTPPDTTTPSTTTPPDTTTPSTTTPSTTTP